MNKQITVADLIKQYILVRDTMAEKQAAFDLSMKPYKDGMEAIESAITAQLLALGDEEGKRNISIPGVGTAYRTQWTSAKVADRDAFHDFVFLHGARQFLTTHVAKEAIVEYMNDHQGVLPPGIDFSHGWKTNIRKA